MAVKSNTVSYAAKKFFVCREKSVLVKDGGDITRDDFMGFVRRGQSEDCFTEENLSYAALRLKEGALLPAGARFISVREAMYTMRDGAFLCARAASLLQQRRTFKFCPACRGMLRDCATQSALECPACGRLYFPRIEPATITLVSRGDELLLVQNKNRERVFYSCIAGFVEQGESAEECAVREIREEVGIEVEDLVYRGSSAWPFPDQLMLAFTARYKSGKLRLQEDEIAEARWFRRGALPPADVLPREGSVAWRLINGAFEGMKIKSNA